MFANPEQLIWLCVSALLAGAVNAIAGGGTLLTFPALLAALAVAGPAEAAVLANATSTVALVPGSLASVWGYRRELRGRRRLALTLMLPSLIGGATGALLVTRLDPSYFAAVVPWLLLMAAGLFLAGPRLPKLFYAESNDGRPPNITALVVLQLGVAIYGGYFGAGIGILMLAFLALAGFQNIHQMNALKSVLGTSINAISVAIFILDDRVVWSFALPMAIASIAGGYLGARQSLRVPAKYVRIIVTCIAVGLAIHFFLRG